jgi:hypothetical protein
LSCSDTSVAGSNVAKLNNIKKINFLSINHPGEDKYKNEALSYPSWVKLCLNFKALILVA